MKSFALTLLALAIGHVSVRAARLRENPADKIVTLLKDMKTKIKADGESEQASYDKYACWCESTLAEKAEAITKAKDKLEELENRIVKNKGGLGSGGATIAQIKKDIEENIKSMEEATAVRKKEGAAYEEDREESEQCIGALEAAIKVLSGAGTGSKKGFLETLQEARLLSVVGSMRQVLKAQKTKQSMKQQDLEVVQQFVNKPEEFLKGKQALGAVQVGNNPFGDYAPKSTQIQGILKSMYDSFTSDLEKDNADEAEKQKAYEELKEVKEEELEKLKESLTSETKTEAERKKEVADDKAMRTTTMEQLDSDEEFFRSSKAGCEKKASQWAQRSRMRTQEIDALTEAIKILDSDEARQTFDDAKKSKNSEAKAPGFLQISAAPGHNKRATAYEKLRSLATRYHSLQLAQIAVTVKSTGHFDDVIAMIDKMIVTLRQEEQEDIEQRDICQNKQNKNKNDKEDAEYRKSQAEAAIKRLEEEIKAKEEDIKEMEKQMGDITKEKEDIKTQREKETDEFKKMQKDDEEAIDLLQKAKEKLEEHYRKTKGLLQTEPRPETNWEGGDYKDSKGEARGVIAMIEMLQEDLRKEMHSQGQDEIDAQESYEKQRLALTKSYRALEASKAEAKLELGQLEKNKADEEEKKTEAEKDIENEEKLEKAIEKNCGWVESHFESRREKRKAEIEGLNSARDFLAGAGTDQDLDMP